MNRGKDKAKPSIDFEVLHIGLCDAVICTRLPIKEATIRLNRESPTGSSHRWTFDRRASNQSPCPDGQGKTHYRLFCQLEKGKDGKGERNEDSGILSTNR